MQTRGNDRSYAIIRLDSLRSDSWAVIGLPSGAIVLDLDGELIMRLDREDAERIAGKLNDVGRVEKDLYLPRSPRYALAV